VFCQSLRFPAVTFGNSFRYRSQRFVGKV